MKWKKGHSEIFPEKTFLVIKDDLVILDGKGKHRRKPKTANTGTWPPKMKRVMPICEEIERPKTANLERPSILDPDLADKLDMSLLSKELLCASMTRVQQSKISGGIPAVPSSSRYRQSFAVGEELQQILTPCASTWCKGSSLRHKRRSFEQLLDTKLCQIDLFANSPRMQEQARITQEPKKQSPDSRKLDNNNNRNGTNGVGKVSLSSLKKTSARSAVPADFEVFTVSSTKSAPEPCKACGRPDQPERFHSHPKGLQPKPKENLTNLKSRTSVPKSIQKPVALNFRSDKSKLKSDKVTVPQEIKSKPVTPQDHEGQPSRPSSTPSKKGPRTVTCYICGREFGTASLPIHEPKCMQKWERENNSLPINQRRPTPQRPDVPINHIDWNAAAWEQSQAQLVPCSKCGRTFLPERLPVHERSCKATAKTKNSDAEKCDVAMAEKQPVSAPRMGPPTVACHICGRNFGTKSIRIHEQQCSKRWQLENQEQLSGQRKKETVVRLKSRTTGIHANATPLSLIGGSHIGEHLHDVQQKRTVTCYICGRGFGSKSIAIHEPQCLKKWHIENDKLPANQRRQEPQKPTIVYTNDPDTGKTTIDLEAMAEASWKSHLSQLIPCKHCGRTFNPDRVGVHERSCKGNL